MMGNTPRPNRRRSIEVIGCAVLAVAIATFPSFTGPDGSGSDTCAPKAAAAVPKKRVAVLSSSVEPKANTSQGLYIQILREAGFEARAIIAAEVRDKKLEGVDIFVIGGGSGTAFNKSLGAEGGKVVQEFVRKGGGALASCAGGYSFVNGPNEALRYIAIAKASVIDNKNGRWARGKGEVEIAPADDRYRPLTMYYANGPLWEIAEEQGLAQ